MIPDYAERLRTRGMADRPWLIAGSSVPPRKRPAAIKEGFAVLAIGNAAARFESDLAYVVDIETMRAHGGAMLANAGIVVMPREPHEDGWASGKSLDAYAEELPALRQLVAEDRLFGFDLSTAANPFSGAVVTGDYEGEEAPLRLLVSAGVKIARHLGTRDRREASSGFESAPCVGKRKSGGGLADLRRTAGISYGPYGYPVPARIFVEAGDEQAIGLRVLEYSIDKFSTMDVSVEPLERKSMPVPKDPKNRPTGSSLCRFGIPRLCNYSGRGLYANADMQVFADITDLWTLPMEDADLFYALTHPSQGSAPQTSVMLLNCEALRWDVPEIVHGLDEGWYSYEALISDLCVVEPGRCKPLIPYWWNSLEIYEPGRTALMHYADIDTQPWFSRTSRNGALWYACCAEAIDNGYIEISEVEDAVEHGHISPEIFDWIGRPTTKDFSEMKATWVAPPDRITGPGKPEGAIALRKEAPEKLMQPGVHAFKVQTLDRRAELMGSPVRIEG